jgi:hypothetical protein
MTDQVVTGSLERLCRSAPTEFRMEEPGSKRNHHLATIGKVLVKTATKPLGSRLLRKAVGQRPRDRGRRSRWSAGLRGQSVVPNFGDISGEGECPAFAAFVFEK